MRELPSLNTRDREKEGETEGKTLRQEGRDKRESGGERTRGGGEEKTMMRDRDQREKGFCFCSNNTHVTFLEGEKSQDLGDGEEEARPRRQRRGGEIHGYRGGGGMFLHVTWETSVRSVSSRRSLRVLLSVERSETTTVLLLLVMRRLTVRWRRSTGVRRRRGTSVVHSDVRRRTSSVLGTHRGTGRSLGVHPRVRGHVLGRRGVVHRRAHSVKVTSLGHPVVSSVVSTEVSSSSSVTHTVVSLAVDLALDTLSVRSVADHGQDRSDRLDELGTLSRLGVVERGLYDVVCEPRQPRMCQLRIRETWEKSEGSRVPKETLEPLLDEKFVDDRTTTSRVGDSDTLLDDVRRELLSREGRNVAEELTDDRFDETVVVQVEDVLDDVVTLIFTEIVSCEQRGKA